MSAERGFSERDHIMKDNQCIETLKSWRIVKDYVKANVYSPDTLSIDSDLVQSVKTSKVTCRRFHIKHLIHFEICVCEICKKFVYKHSETIE